VDWVKLVAIVLLIAVIGLLFAGIISELGSAATQTEAAYTIYRDDSYTRGITGTRAKFTRLGDVARTFLIDPVFGEKWSGLVSILSGSLITFILAWLLVRLVRMVLS